jgi:tetratricopeptide (TPR) repeat protein
MLEGLRRLFRRAPDAPEPGSLVEELWLADLGGPKTGRFVETDEGDYASRYVLSSEGESAFELELRKSDLFAWAEAPLYRHSDFSLEGEFEIPAGQAHSACGFLFRYQDEKDFYSVLVSNRGYFRLDTVFNGHPRPLVAWTEVPGREEPKEQAAGPEAWFSIRVIARGGRLTILIDDKWAAEAEDAGFDRGHIAFAAQNYGDSGGGRFRLRSCAIDSRPLEVEAAYYRWNYYLAPDPEARRLLAQTLFAMGESLAASVQIRKIERRRPLDAGEHFLKAETSLRLGLQDEAAAALDDCLELDPGREEAIEEKANLLYLRARYLELRDYLEPILSSRRDSARLLCLSGHARFGLGDYTGAAAEYRSAALLAQAAGGPEDGSQALFRMNEARAWDQARRKEEAVGAYLAAARLFSSQEADEDLALALRRLSELKAGGEEVEAIRAKTLFRSGSKQEAKKLLSRLVERGSQDSGCHYLLGLILAEEGQGERALERFSSACELEPEYPLYAFRYAERLFLLGREAGSAIARALELAEGREPSADEATRAWISNLAGQAALARGDLAEARRRLETARAALPAASEPAINLAELESREGRQGAAIAVLEPFPESAACRNQAGNAYAKEAERIRSAPGYDAAAADENLEAAAREYLKATVLDPYSAEYQTNLAAASLELERYSEAEERVRRALDSGGGPRTLLIAGNLASVYGDLPRAEAAYRIGLEPFERRPRGPGMESRDRDVEEALLSALGRCYLGLGQAAKAEAAAERLEALSAERAARLRAEILEATTEPLSCSSCGRAWRVPRTLPAQSSASIRAMPPDDCPAGACPRCGRIFCIACRKDELVENRFTCPECGEALKLSDDRLRYLVREGLRRAGA